MKNKIINEIKRFIKEEKAASLVEYALVIAAGAVLTTVLKPTFEDIIRSGIHQNSEFEHYYDMM
jgi:Flp pilus assembly pilin Flp